MWAARVWRPSDDSNYNKILDNPMRPLEFIMASDQVQDGLAGRAQWRCCPSDLTSGCRRLTTARQDQLVPPTATNLLWVLAAFLWLLKLKYHIRGWL